MQEYEANLEDESLSEHNPNLKRWRGENDGENDSESMPTIKYKKRHLTSHQGE